MPFLAARFLNKDTSESVAIVGMTIPFELKTENIPTRSVLAMPDLTMPTPSVLPIAAALFSSTWLPTRKNLSHALTKRPTLWSPRNSV